MKPSELSLGVPSEDSDSLAYWRRTKQLDEFLRPQPYPKAG